ncbi:MAG: ISL3 family transposase [Spirochaetaceae bacterium]|nr:ISL3 family transposase [Spirochaetaceae bacterium]
MLCNDYTTKLLDMEHMEVKNIEVYPERLIIYVEMERRATRCPCCGAETDRVHDYREQTVKDCPVQGKKLIWKYKKRRYRCENCGKRFYEQNWLLPKFHRITNRLALLALNKLSVKVSRKDIAEELGVSESTVCRWMHLAPFSKPKKLPTVLSIDEFRGNAGGEKFQCILTAPTEKRILDILGDRKERTIFNYLKEFPNKKDVKYFVTDMRKEYVSMAKILFPNAKIVIDKFHVVRYCTWAFENVRKRVQKALSDEKRKYFKRSRTLLLKHKDDLNDDDKLAVSKMLEINKALADAYLMKEKFYYFMSSRNSTEARDRLKQFAMFNAATQLPEFEPLIRVLSNWSEYILNAFDCGYTNGFTEGCNNKIKVLKRIAFGYRSFSNMRQRILLSTNAT